jgi:nucleoside-diphosphate-sugar epimerase
LKVLVAGGAGFIGSHVCEELLRRGHSVVCLDDLSTGVRSNLAGLQGQPGFQYVHADVREAPTLQVDAILHLASPASPIDYERMPIETLAANSLGTWRLLEMARHTGAAMTFVSTSEVYGDPLVHPQPETYWGNVDPVGPRACYDESKRFGEALLMSMRQTTGQRANIVRVFNTYGPRMRRRDGRVIPELLNAALAAQPLLIHGDGSQTRSFCYVSDLVEGLLQVTLDPELDGAIFNLGNPQELTILELAREIAALVRPDLELRFGPARPGDPGRRRPDINRIHERYGWRPRVPLREGLRRTIASLVAATTATAETDRRPVVDLAAR